MRFYTDLTGYQLLNDAYSGGGGFLDGRYLIRHSREDDEKLFSRKELSYYSNFVKPVVDSLTNPIFRKTITRDWQGNSKFISGFINDVDKKGTTLNRFMKKATKTARLHGVAFIVVDNSSEIVPTVAEAVKKRAYPYLYLVKPEQVYEYSCDKNGVLTSITYEVNSAFSNGVANYNVETWTWTRTYWKKEMAEQTTIQQEHNLGRVPVIPLFGVDEEPGDLLPVSPMITIARTNLAIFNLCSELREILRNQAFSILCYPLTTLINKGSIQEGITTGTDNVLPFDGEKGQPPLFISPSAEQASLIQSEIARLIEDIYRQANLTSVVAVQTKQSGVAKQWDFEQTNQILADMAENDEIAEREIIKTLGLWTNEEIDYNVIYPRDFGIVDVQSELDKVAAALDLHIGGPFDSEAMIKAAEVFLADIPEENYDVVIRYIKSKSMTDEQQKVFAVNE